MEGGLTSLPPGSFRFSPRSRCLDFVVLNSPIAAIGMSVFIHILFIPIESQLVI